MKMSRRDFVATGLAGAAGVCVGGWRTGSNAAETPARLPDEDGYKLWLRYAPPGDATKNYRRMVRQIRVDGSSATSEIIRGELRSATTTMLGSAVLLSENELLDGTVIVGTPGNSALVRELNWTADLSAAGDEGFLIRSARMAKHRVTVIASSREAGALYGVFHFLRLLQTGQPIGALD